MKYFYEYKIKNGAKVGGHNLEKIDIYKNTIVLIGVDYAQTQYGEDEQNWHQTLNPNEIEYIKIEPMMEEE